MRKSISILLTIMLLCSMFSSLTFADTAPYVVSMEGETVIEMEDVIVPGRTDIWTESSSASGGYYYSSDWELAKRSPKIIPVKVEDTGVYTIEYVFGKSGFNYYSKWDLYFGDIHLGSQASSDTLAGYGNKSEISLYKYSAKNLTIPAGEYNLKWDLEILTDHTAYMADYIKITPVEGFGITGTENQKADLDTWTLDQAGSNGSVKDDANAMGGSYGYSDWCSIKEVIIPVNVKKSTYYDIEYVLGQPAANDDNYYGWTLYIGDTVLNDSKTASGTSAGLGAVNSAIPMRKFKNERVYLEEGTHIVKLALHDGESDGKHTFAADYIEFIPYAVEGEAYTAIDTFKIADGVVLVEGRILNSIGKAYEGLSAEIYLTLPGVDAVKIGEVTSGADGKFSLNYTLPEDKVNGVCTVEVIAEYAEPAEETYEYMSSIYLLPIFEEFRNTSDAESVFDTYREVLGVDDVNDTKALSDADLFYDAFGGKTLTGLEEFRTLYAETLVKEKINQAESMDDVKAVITNDDNVKTIGLDLDKLSALNNDGIEYTAGALYDLPRVDEVKDFADKFEDVIFNDALLFQFAIGAFTLEADSESVKQGQTTELEIKAKSAIDNVRKIELTVAFEDDLDGEYDNFELETELGQCEEIKDLTYEITPAEVTDGVTDIAKISFIPEKVGEGKVKVEGKVTLDNTTDYDAVADITSIEYTVDVAEQVKQSIGGGSSSGRGSGGVSFGGASAIVPVPSADSQQTQVQGKSYKDLASVPWAEEAIVGLYNLQAIAMPEDGMFNPNRTITRAEFIKMVILANAMWRGADLENDFNDVSKDDWYYQYLVSAVNNGLITGDSDGNFRPADPITREDICVILARLKKINNAGMLTPFADDAEISEYAKIAVYYMQEAGIVNGVGDGKFAPKANATRAEAAKIIYGTVK